MRTLDQAEFVLRVPANLDLAGAAPLLCAGITTRAPLRRQGVTKGKKVGVVGLGGLGHRRKRRRSRAARGTRRDAAGRPRAKT